MDLLRSTEAWAAARALLLLMAANAAPWAAGRLLRTRLSAPLDGGLRLRDGRRLLGDHKTWRGLACGTLLCGVLASTLELSFALGCLFGLLALVGDALSSIIKRRLRRAPGAEVPGLDQLPEALLPLLLLAPRLGLHLVSASLVTLLFALLDLFSLPLRHPRKRAQRD